ncbi:hypothetical protein F8S13_00380 [Chloroflexia bacterium SDU3-3]|nr:hypothetical protein F8S13_00380 [Chloroflexia bacterium SDU3-3]
MNQIRQMPAKSWDVLRHPRPHVFAAHARHVSDGNMDAPAYLAIAIIIPLVFSAILYGLIDPLGMLRALIQQMFAFYIFTGVIFFFAQQQGALGSFAALAYGFALFYVPIELLQWLLAMLGALLPAPWWAGLAIVVVAYLAKAWFAQVAVRGIMGVRRPGEAWAAVGAGLVTIIILSYALRGGIVGI